MGRTGVWIHQLLCQEGGIFIQSVDNLTNNFLSLIRQGHNHGTAFLQTKKLR